MRWVRFAILVLLTALLQAGLVDILSLTSLNIKPDLLLVLMVFFAVFSNTKDAIITSFSIGFAADIIGTAAVGAKMFSFGICGTILAYLTQLIIIRKMPYQALIIFATALLTGILAHLLNTIKIPQTADSIYTAILGMAVYSAVIGPFYFLPSAWWMCIKTHHFSPN
ncbi:MAG: rod shape-determining protein MreD [Planctomycetota bacterium]|jgi:rod shape-determining protein MreD